MKLQCSKCTKDISSEIPVDDITVRAYLECPECVDFSRKNFSKKIRKEIARLFLYWINKKQTFTKQFYKVCELANVDPNKISKMGMRGLD